MAHRTVLFGIDLGTSSTTANRCLVSDTRDNLGNVIRTKQKGIPLEIKDWPGAARYDATGNICLPTDLVYDRITLELLFWGFQAKQYLDDPVPEIPRQDVFHVEHIKLLLPDPDKAKVLTPASKRYLAQREELRNVLNKEPKEVFEDFMNCILEHIVTGAHRDFMHRLLGEDRIELILAFPSGWPDYIHTMVAEIASRAMKKAISKLKLEGIQFGTENVYTFSETLCGVKEWFKGAIAETALSNDLIQRMNLDDLKEGDCFLPCDIGGGTGCITPLQLVSKHPLQVDQLGPTLSLDISGEAVEAEFEKRVRKLITKHECPKDIDKVIAQITRKFKEDKKDCGEESRNQYMSFPAQGLSRSAKKGWASNYFKIEKVQVEQCFDRVLDLLDKVLDEALKKYPGITMIVFLGQFGGSSQYLRKKMARSPISKNVRICHSQSGKLNVVRGAISERLQLNESFVRKFQTLKSYGTLITMPYRKGEDAWKLFPNAKQKGATFEEEWDETFVVVIQWAISKGTTLENGTKESNGNDITLLHTWPHDEKTIKFDDVVIVSDESAPPPNSNGDSLTLWTEAHDKNELYHQGQRMHVSQIKFLWTLDQSEKLDADGAESGPFNIDDMEIIYIPEGATGDDYKYRKLDYQLLWNITEMQAKVSIKPLFPGVERPKVRLLQQIAISPADKVSVGEFRSKALQRDIEIVTAAESAMTTSTSQKLTNIERVKDQNPLTTISRRRGPKDVETLGAEYSEFQPDSPQHTPATSSSRLRRRILNPNVRTLEAEESDNEDTFITNNSQKIERRRPNCHTCRVNNRKCDQIFSYDEITNSKTCNTCLDLGVHCQIRKKKSPKVPGQLEAEAIGRGKRKQKDLEDSDSSSTIPGDRSAMDRSSYGVWPSNRRSSTELSPNIFELPADVPPTRKRGTYTAVRGGKNGSKNLRS